MKLHPIENQDTNTFYCYSYQLTKFLQMNHYKYIGRYQNKVCKWVWIFERTEELNEILTLWNDYKSWKRDEAKKHQTLK